jgi:hypothetical protein
MATLNAKVTVSIIADLINALDLTSPKDPLRLSHQEDLANGTGANQANMLWHDQRTLSTGASENIDLAGALTNAFGTTITFTKIKALLIENLNSSRTLTIGGASSNAWIGALVATNDLIVIQPGGVFLITAPGASGMAVVADTGDILKVLNAAGGDTTYNIAIIGTV